MTDLLSGALIAAGLVAMLATAVPLALAALGESVGEQTGVLNLGVEGQMLLGAYAAFATAVDTGSTGAGLLAGAATGLLLAGVMVLLSIVLGLNQIIVGLGITLLGTGLAGVLVDARFGGAQPRLPAAEVWRIPLLSDLPVVGSALFAQPVVFWITALFLVVAAFGRSRTVWGLRLRAAGQRPETLDRSGGSVVGVRVFAAGVGGTLAGLGGASLALVSAGTFTAELTNGLGYLAIVTAMLARGRVAWVAIIALLFGLCTAVGTALQLTVLALPADVVHIAPFVIVMVVLALGGGRGGLPPALGVAYARGSR